MNAIATTWGISSALFLEAYISLCAVAAIAAVLARRDPQGVRVNRNDPLPELDPYKLAMLSGGPQLAITAAAAKLHDDGLLRHGADDRTLEVSGALPAGADRLERAVFDAVRHEPGITARALRAQVAEGEEVRWLSEDLTRAGLLDEQRSGSLGWVWLTGGLLVALGGARIAAGVANDAAVGALVAIVVVVAWGTVRLARRRPPATKRGREILKRHRTANAELRRSPATGETALAAALFGGGALWLAEPAFASALDVPREAARGNGWNNNAGCSSGGCGSSSWGSSCGSGGSDGGGGGGGCGGGGCGGGGS